MVSSYKSVRANLKKTLDVSVVMDFLRRSRVYESDAWVRGRSLTKEEIHRLESSGNTCQDWSEVRVIGPGLSNTIHQCRFEGRVMLRTENGAPRLWRSRVRDVVLGAVVMEDVGLADRLIIEDQVQLRRVDEITGRAGTLFCLGLPIHPGSETKTRRVLLCDGLLLSDCMDMAELIPADQEALEREFASWLDGLESGHAFIGKGTQVERTSQITNCFIGAGTVIRGASAVRRSILASSPENPVHIGDDALISDSVLEPGTHVDSAGQVHRSLLLESSSVERAGQVEDTVLGPNTSIAKGEITASLVGPFVGFHHQALLISALWPEGHGNVGYGANVGSNHTGRKPDQEIRPGEGAFFGLGCSVKFPADLSAAPYSLFATGITLLPQRLAFPFSLITAPSGPVADTAFGLNEIFPGWMWGENAYALIRNAYKYANRNRAKRHILPNPGIPENSPLQGSFLSAGLFAPRIVDHVIHALLELQNISKSDEMKPKEIYGEKELQGLGENFLRVQRLQTAIAAYEDYLRFALCRAVLWNPIATPLSSVAAPIRAALGVARGQAPDFDPETLFRNLLHSAEAALAKDGRRGREIFHDYGSFHEDPSAELVCQHLRRDLDNLLGPLRKRWKRLFRA